MFGADSAKIFEEEPSRPRYRDFPEEDDVPEEETTAEEVRFTALPADDATVEVESTEGESRSGRGGRRRRRRGGRGRRSGGRRGDGEATPATAHVDRPSREPVDDEDADVDADFEYDSRTSAVDEDFGQDPDHGFDIGREDSEFSDDDDRSHDVSAERPEGRQRKIPSWRETVQILIDRNLAHRGPDTGGGPRRRRGGRGRR